MLDRTIIAMGLVAQLAAGPALAADPAPPPVRDAGPGLSAEEDPVPETTRPDRPKPPPARAAARVSASASASATARTGPAGTDCAADASASVEREGRRITVERSHRAQDGAAGCRAEARARTHDAPGE